LRRSWNIAGMRLSSSFWRVHDNIIREEETNKDKTRVEKLKDSNALESAECTIANHIQGQPAFMWWGTQLDYAILFLGKLKIDT
jgi:hypothetical protein